MSPDDELQELWEAGPRAHIATNYDFVHQNGQMQILLKPEVHNQAEKLNCQVRYVSYKFKCIHDFIQSLPPTFHSWALSRRKSSVPESDIEAALEAITTPVPSPRGPQPKAGGRRRAAVVNVNNAESIEDAKKKAQQSYFPEPNRLQCELTAEVVREICQHIYDSVLMANPPWNLRVGSVEAALLAWDLTSQIHGCCRIPMTLVTQREGRQYTFVFVLLMLEDHFALLGRYLLKELCYLPLQRQKISDVVDRVGDILDLRNHSLSTLYLGLPTDGTSAPDESPTFWRVLKLSCRRQEWHSVLAACDFYMARRQQVRELLSEVLLAREDPEQGEGHVYQVFVPQGLALWTNARGEPRLKVTEPLLVRKRLKKIPKKVRRSPHGGTAAMDKKSVAALSMKMGAMEQKHPHEQEPWHHLAFSRPIFSEATTSASAVEWPPKEESECSSVSSASLDEYAEDFCIDRHLTRSVFQALN